MTIDPDGKRSTAAFAKQDNDLIFRRPGDRADALFSTGFGICDALHQLSADSQQGFKDQARHSPHRTCLVQFEDGLKHCLKMEQDHDLKEFTTTLRKVAALGMTNLQDEDHPGASKPPLLDTVTEDFRNIPATATPDAPSQGPGED